MALSGLKKLRIVISAITILYLVVIIFSYIVAIIDEAAWMNVIDDPTITTEDWQTFNRVLNKVEDKTIYTDILGYCFSHAWCTNVEDMASKRNIMNGLKR